MLKWEKLEDARAGFVEGEWEQIFPTERGTLRASVPGGWLVRFGWIDGSGDTHSMIFLPDAAHAWDGSSSH